MAKQNTERVLSAFWQERVSEADLHGSTGYGYGDAARDKLERVYAAVFGGERAMVRAQIVSGTHALKLALFGMVRPGEHIVIATGRPYDTLEAVLGLRPAVGSLSEWGVTTTVVPLTAAGTVDLDAVSTAIRPNTTVLMLQKSRGYQHRPTLLNRPDLVAVIQMVKSRHPHVSTLVDNCYGEFVEISEPCLLGADVIAGSLIKNPGGGIASTGGYVVGKEALILRIATGLTAPGVGLEAGPTEGFMRPFFQGLFMAPHTVAQALKTSCLFAEVLSGLGYDVSPEPRAPRGDLILAVTLRTPAALLAFCRAIQRAAPIDAHVVPQDAPMPGYEHAVVMAAGSFVQGSTSDLSADGPLRVPYTAYVQGGLTYEHGYYAAIQVVETLLHN